MPLGRPTGKAAILADRNGWPDGNVFSPRDFLTECSGEFPWVEVAKPRVSAKGLKGAAAPDLDLPQAFGPSWQ